MSKIICWWSGGVASAVACGITLKKHGKENCYLAFCDTGIEHPDTYRFMRDFEEKFGVKVNIHKSKRFNNPEEVWRKYNGLNFAHGAPCSMVLKKEVRIDVQKQIEYSAQVFGFDYCDKEKRRASQLQKNHPDAKPVFPLLEGKITRDDLFKVLKEWGLTPPKTYNWFLNNNCIGPEDSPQGGCVQGGVGYWQRLKEIFPKKYFYMAKIEHELSKVKGEPVTICKDQRETTKGRRLFLVPCEQFPEVGTILEIHGKQPQAPMECNGLCSLEDEGTQEALDIFDDHLKEIFKLASEENDGK